MGETHLRKASNILFYGFLVLFSIAGLALTAYLFYQYITIKLIGSPNLSAQIQEIVILTVVCALCRSLPLPTQGGKGSMDISTIIFFAAFLLNGPEATAVVIFFSTIFTFVRWEDKKLKHIFNTPILQTLFNNGILTISMFAGALLFSLLGCKPGDITLPGILLPSFLYLTVNMLVNCLFMSLLYRMMQGVPFGKTLVNGIVSMVPTLLAFAPIGIFLAMVFRISTSGPYLALLFFVPLLFARYAWKLYLHSKEQFLRTISTLTAAIEAKDPYTEGHSKRVAEYSVALAQQMKLRNAQVENIKVAAVLHDIGKIGIEDEILRKPTQLNPEEWNKILQHPAIGVKILDEVDMPDTIKEMIHYHHIRYDRKGYPEDGRDKALPIEVHIISLADAYDAMTSDRPYRKAMSDDTAIKIIEQENGTQFHPDVVEAFLELKKRK
jgi:putative nucleotidyltransferase with HDIG domain